MPETLRRIHHVGTIPVAGVETAMRLMLGATGRHLTSVPDGENTDDRINWVVGTVRRRQAHPGVRVIRGEHFDHDPMRPWDGAWLHPRRGQALDRELLSLRYSHHAEIAEAILDQLLEPSDSLWSLTRPPHPAPLLQLDIVGPFNAAAFTWGPEALRRLDDEIAGAVDEIKRTNAIAGAHNVIYQISLPVETYMVARAGKAARQVARWCARRLARFLTELPPGTRVILHLCLGDPHGKPLIQLTDTNPLVVFTEEIMAFWPSAVTLDAVHYPLSDGLRPAPLAEAFYTPLRRLVDCLPDDTHLSAGLAHVAATLAHQRHALAITDDAAGRQCGVSTPCGLGRRPEQLSRLMTRMVQLATSVGDRHA